MNEAGRELPTKGSLDTLSPSVRSGLEVVEFDVEGAMIFSQNIAGKNLYRIAMATADGKYAQMLFTAAIASGMTYGAMAERRRK